MTPKGEPAHRASLISCRSSKPIPRRGRIRDQRPRATVSVVGACGKIATVASADRHRPNVGAVFFFSTVSAHRKRAGRFLQHLLGQMPLSVVRPRGAHTGDEVRRLEETLPPFRRRPTGRAARRAYPCRAPSACETRGSRRGRNKGSVGDGERVMSRARSRCKSGLVQ